MPNWSASMQQTFEYYLVDPISWKDKKILDKVKSCTINWDSEAETLGSATIDVTDVTDECYIRVYLVTIQNGLRERFPLGTFLVQTPSSSFDGKSHSSSMDAYTPLIELKENNPPLGYSMLRGGNIMERAYQIVRDNARAPVVKTMHSKTLYNDFVANTEDTWISFTNDLIANVKYKLGLDEMCRILFVPEQDTASLQPVWTYDDSNSSILHPEVSVNRDLYGIPNVVEVIYSTGTEYYYGKAVNDDPNSPISTVNRGRTITHRVPNPGLPGNPTAKHVQEYAEQVLREMSCLEYTISYTHGYCPVRLGDCIRLNYVRAGLVDVKAKVVYQSIKCQPGCPVTEKAVFTKKLWR